VDSRASVVTSPNRLMLIALGAVGLRVRIHLSRRRWELENVHVVASTSSYRFPRKSSTSKNLDELRAIELVVLLVFPLLCLTILPPKN